MKKEKKFQMCIDMASMYYVIGDITVPFRKRIDVLNAYLQLSGISGLTIREKYIILKSVEQEVVGKGEKEFLAEKIYHCAKTEKI